MYDYRSAGKKPYGLTVLAIYCAKFSTLVNIFYNDTRLLMSGSLTARCKVLVRADMLNALRSAEISDLHEGLSAFMLLVS